MPVLNFKGKSIVYSHHLGVPFRSLEIDEKKSLPKKSKNGKKEKLSLDDNLIIHGDNLHALKALLPRYAGKVKCIYIDPPYNTGNEGWKYNDNVNSPLIKEWLGKVVGVDDLERHDKWLCMMWPRLHLLKELLSDDGVIFISIDDNEVSNLKSICNETFAESNFIGSITVQGNPRGRDYGGIARMHDYILVYSKSSNCVISNLEDKDKKFPYKDKISEFEIRELRNRNIAFNIGNRPNLYYPFYLNPHKKDENGFFELSLTKSNRWIEVLPKESQGVKTVWRFSKETSKKHLNKNIVGKSNKNGGYQVVEKYRETSRMARSIWNDKDVNTERATLFLKNLFNSKVFNFPKPHEMIIRVLKMGTFKNSIILDSFAGSGTTAQAVLDLNKEDGGNRKFILVECENYADKITAERVRRVIKGVPKAKEEKLKKGLGGSFTYCTLGKEINEENLIKGKSLPIYKVLSSYVYYVATGQTLDKVNENEDFYIGKSDKETAFFVIYKPSIKFLRSRASALNLDRKEKIQKIMIQKKCKKAVVFAPVHYFDSTGELAKEGIIFCQLPFAIYKIASV